MYNICDESSEPVEKWTDGMCTKTDKTIILHFTIKTKVQKSHSEKQPKHIFI